MKSIDTPKIPAFDYNGVMITDPSISECGRFKVNLEEYYGDAYLQAKRCSDLIQEITHWIKDTHTPKDIINLQDLTYDELKEIYQDILEEQC